MGLQNTDFNALVEDLQVAMDHEKISFRDQNRFLAKLARSSGRRSSGSDTAHPGSRACSDVEPDALGQRQGRAVVHGVGGAAHVGLPAVGAGLAAAAGLLLAAERAADLGARGADVDVGDAAVGALRRDEQLGLAQVVGEDRRRQALRHVVLQARWPRRGRGSA